MISNSYPHPIVTGHMVGCRGRCCYDDVGKTMIGQASNGKTSNISEIIAQILMKRRKKQFGCIQEEHSFLYTMIRITTDKNQRLAQPTSSERDLGCFSLGV